MIKSFLSRLAFLLLTILVVSCDDEPNNPISDASIFGEWTLQSMQYSGGNTVVSGNETYAAEFNGTAKNISTTMTLNEDGTYTSMGNYTVDVAFTFGNQTFTQETTYTDFLGGGTYTRSDDLLTFTFDPNEEAMEGQIIRLSDTELSLKVLVITESVDNESTSRVRIDGQYEFVRN